MQSLTKGETMPVAGTSDAKPSPGSESDESESEQGAPVSMFARHTSTPAKAKTSKGSAPSSVASQLCRPALAKASPAPSSVASVLSEAGGSQDGHTPPIF